MLKYDGKDAVFEIEVKEFNNLFAIFDSTIQDESKLKLLNEAIYSFVLLLENCPDDEKNKWFAQNLEEMKSIVNTILHKNLSLERETYNSKEIKKIYYNTQRVCQALLNELRKKIIGPSAILPTPPQPPAPPDSTEVYERFREKENELRCSPCCPSCSLI